MERTFSYDFRDGNGQKFRATLTLDDLRAAALSMAQRARRQGRTTVKALDGAVTLKLEVVA